MSIGSKAKRFIYNENVRVSLVGLANPCLSVSECRSGALAYIHELEARCK
jgi:hypothetical protein